MRLNREIQTIMEMPDVKKRLSDLNLNAQSSSPEQAAEALASDIKRWQEVIAKAKIEKQ
jgi:tripartite-type tricarboxylate transporter receptor subunit TctC